MLEGSQPAWINTKPLLSRGLCFTHFHIAHFYCRHSAFIPSPCLLYTFLRSRCPGHLGLILAWAFSLKSASYMSPSSSHRAVGSS